MIAPRVRSNFSIQRAFGQISDLVDRAIELGFDGMALTDAHSMSGHVEFIQYVDKINKKREKKFKALLGLDIRIKLDNKFTYLTAIALNKTGWYDLIKILHLSEIGENGVVYTDWPKLLRSKDSEGLLSNCAIILNAETSCFADTESSHHLNPRKIYRMGECDPNLPECDKTDYYEWPEIGGNLVLFSTPEDLKSFQSVTASRLKCNVAQKDILKADYEGRFTFAAEHYLRTDTDPNNSTDKIVEDLQPFSIASAPNIPAYKDENGNEVAADEYLTELCRKGWKHKKLSSHKQIQVYTERIKYELGIITRYKLSNYFLIIWDITKYIRSLGFDCGLRGSAVGCLISYLIDISTVDPVCPDPVMPYDSNKELLFSRFLNEGRLSKGSVSLPDIDLDVPIGLRHKIIEYIKNKYGHECVAHIITFSRMDGKQAIKEAFRVLDQHPQSYEIANRICEFMVDTSKVQDELEVLREDNPDYNIINYCIDHVQEIENYSKEYPDEFDLALKLTSSIRNTGKHAAGIVIASKPLAELFPLTLDVKTGEFLVGLEMADAEYVGAVKYDILGVAVYDKMWSIDDMIARKLTEPVIVGADDESIED